MEVLVAHAYLWAIGLCSEKQYNEQLDLLFLQKSSDEILLELECCSYDNQKTVIRLRRYLEYEVNSFHVDLFGKVLLNGLKESYLYGNMRIDDFGNQCCKMWTLLPEKMRNEDPFLILSYANDPLSWGNEKRTRELYEKMFDYYG